MSPLTMTLLLVTAIAVLGQSELRIKKPRAKSDYLPRTMPDVLEKCKLAGLSVRENSDFIPDGELRPSRVRLVYGGKQRPIPADRARMIDRWARRFAGSVESYTKSYSLEARFQGKRRVYWLAVHRTLIPRLDSQIRTGDQVDAYLIKLGGAKPGGPGKCLLLVERIEIAEPAHD